MTFAIHPLIALGVVLATATTDAAYVFFMPPWWPGTESGQRTGAPSGTCSPWYLLSAFAVISYKEHAIYVAFAALGSWIGAFISITWLVRIPRWKAWDCFKE